MTKPRITKEHSYGSGDVWRLTYNDYYFEEFFTWREAWNAAQADAETEPAWPKTDCPTATVK